MQKNFSYPIKIDELTQNKYTYILEPDEAEREDIAQILQVEKVCGFKAEIYVKPDHRSHLITVWGEVSAELEIKSVISLENFVQKIKTPFELFFDTKVTYKDIQEMENGIDDNVPDIIENGTINLADLAIEQIALNMDMYPRAEGEVFDYAKYVKEEPEEKENPFAILAKLKK